MYDELKEHACKLIDEVMDAGARQRLAKGRDPEEWRTSRSKDRLHHAWMHLCEAKTHEGKNGHPFGLTEDTYLEHHKHAAVGLIIADLRRMQEDGKELVLEQIDE